MKSFPGLIAAMRHCPTSSLPSRNDGVSVQQDERFRRGRRVKYGIRLLLCQNAFRFPSQCSDEEDDDNSINLRAQNNKSKFRFPKIFKRRRFVSREQKMSFKFNPESPCCTAELSVEFRTFPSVHLSRRERGTGKIISSAFTRKGETTRLLSHSPGGGHVKKGFVLVS